MTKTILCQCGCGEPAPLAKQTDTAKGYKKGQPVRFIAGHHRREPLGKTKVCTGCHRRKPVEDFHRRGTGARSGRSATCMVCASGRGKGRRAISPGVWRDYTWKSKLKNYYGITEEIYEEMLRNQGGVCAVCGERETSTRKGRIRRLSVDHSHDTGKVRGLLCARCNAGLGNFDDDPKVLRAAADYLERFR